MSLYSTFLFWYFSIKLFYHNVLWVHNVHKDFFSLRLPLRLKKKTPCNLWKSLGLWVKNLPQGSPRAQCSQRIFSQRIQEISDKFDSIIEDAEFFYLWHEKLHFIFDIVKNLSANSKSLKRQKTLVTSALKEKNSVSFVKISESLCWNFTTRFSKGTMFTKYIFTEDSRDKWQVWLNYWGLRVFLPVAWKIALYFWHSQKSLCYLQIAKTSKNSR